MAAMVWLTPPSPSRYIPTRSPASEILGLVDPAVSKSLYSMRPGRERCTRVWLTPPSPSRYIRPARPRPTRWRLVDPAVSKSLYSSHTETPVRLELF